MPVCLAQRLVGTFLVELPTEAIEADLLRSQGPFRRPDRLALQRAMHTLMAAVLLRMRWLD